MNRLILLSLLSVAGWAQTGRNVVLNWAWTDAKITDPQNVTYKVKRAPGLCSGTPNYSVIASAVTAKTYTDTTAPIGPSCYAVVASYAGADSPDSNTAAATLLPAAPVLGTVTFAVLVPPTPEIVAAVMGY